MMWRSAALILALAGAGAVSSEAQTAAPPAARPARGPDSDQTVQVSRGTRLTMNHLAGEVIVRGWDRDAVRVQARHASRTQVSIDTSRAGQVTVSASGSRGPAGPVDYEINVPVWMPVKIDGTYVYIAVEGTQADVSAETVRGDIAIKGGASQVTAESVEGEVRLENVRGRISASSVNQGVTITGAAGDIVADSVNGHIVLTGIEGANVEVGTVNGNIRYEGTAAANGRYRFTTHNGNIAVAVPESANATFSVRTYNGSVNSSLPLKGGGAAERGRRQTYTLGNGSAEFELESFGGTIQLRKPGSTPAAVPKTKQKEPEI